jgi:hypothetical protein
MLNSEPSMGWLKYNQCIVGVRCPCCNEMYGNGYCTDTYRLTDADEEVCELECTKCHTIWQLPLLASTDCEASAPTTGIEPAAFPTDRRLRHAAVRKLLRASWSAEDGDYQQAAKHLPAYQPIAPPYALEGISAESPSTSEGLVRCGRSCRG